ncbi:MAG: hypothetical protein A2V66_05760, partial [Ignavibacteria bacterium RBG_13_36_8]
MSLLLISWNLRKVRILFVQSFFKLLRIKYIFLFFLLYRGTTNAFQFQDSVQYSTFNITANSINTSITIDGVFDEEAWRSSTWINRFIQREPNEGTEVSESTEACILFDTDNLYIGFRCLDSEPDKIVANEMRRDQPLLNNDFIEIYFDTYHDHRIAFFFGTNPLGAQWDGIIISDESFDQHNWDWNGVWENVSLIDDNGWYAEIRIPFKTLRFNNAEEQIWGINFARNIPRKREEAYWTPILRDYGYWGKYKLSLFGHLTGLRNIAQPEKWQIKPYTLFGIQRDIEESTEHKGKFDVGLDVKYLLTSNLTIDLSVKTDFAQVEADQEMVNLTRFELFFPEKREFFLEGASIFRFGERAFSPIIPATVLFFSRRIGLSDDNEVVPLIGGLKLTGKTDSYNIGFMNMLADKIKYVNDDGDSVSIPITNYTAFRLKKDISTNSFIGVLGLNKESLENKSFNRTFGVDANFFLSNNAQVSMFAAKTSTPDMKGKDLAFYGDFIYMDDLWTILFSQNSIQDNFNPEMGFAPRTGVRKTQINFGISPRPGILSIRQLTLFNDFNYIAKQNGELESRVIFYGLYSVFENGANGFGMLIQEYEQLDEEFEVHDDVNIQPGVYKFNYFYGEFQS